MASSTSKVPRKPITSGEAAPQLGNLVRVRDRLWVVGEVQPSNLEPDVLVGVSGRVDHLVSLTSIEDDGFGDELSVIWEAEPGTQVIEKPTLPDPSTGKFDSPERLGAFLDAVRWGAITSADTDALQSPFRAGIELEDYQLAPLVKALSMPRANLLIADDVGLGKTIEAGLVIQELMLRHRARTVMVLCPPSLCVKWQAEMSDRFGLDFRILDSTTVKQLRRERGFGVNPFTHHPRLIASLDWVKLEAQRALLAEILPPDSNIFPRKFDLLVVDEVHTCAPPAVGKYATDSMRTKLIRYLGPHFEHRLFLSATPHNGYPESFQGLLELLDRQRFAKGVEPSVEQLGQVMVRRLKSELAAEAGPRPDGSPRFPKREIHAIRYTYPKSELDVHAALEEYTKLISSVANGNRAAEVSAKFVTLLLKKRLLSSPAAFHHTITQHISTINRNVASTVLQNERAVQERFAALDDDYVNPDELDEAMAEALAIAAVNTEKLSVAAEKSLTKMRLWGEANAGRPDAKTTALLGWLDNLCRPDKVWNRERVIVFTEYYDTLEYLRTLLTAKGLGGDRLAVIHGGLPQQDRQQIVDAFQYDPDVTPVRILLATDAASEGIDLQRFCHRVVHLECPFSPTRLEQRNGRVDRHGQKSPVVDIFHMVGESDADTPAAADSDFLYRIAIKIEQIRNGLGSANPVLEQQIEEALTGRRRQLDDKSIDQAASKAAQRLKRIELNLRDEVHRLRDRLDESVRDLGIEPQAIERVVAIGLELGHQLPLEPIEHRAGKGIFRVPDLTGSWAGTLARLNDPITLERRPVTFDAEVARGRTDVIHLHLGHPLVLRATRLLRAQVWAIGSHHEISRVAACMADVEQLTLVAHARVVITGADGSRLHEEVVAAAGRWNSGRLARLNVGDTAKAVAAFTERPAPDHVTDMLAGQWDRMRGLLEAALEARAAEVGEQRRQRLDRRRDAESSTISKVLGDLASTIRAELDALEKEPEATQLKLDGFDNEDERRQFRRDFDALRRRIDEIPAEIEGEQQRIIARYATRDVHRFPVSVTFLVPQSMRGTR
jgi:superfamily II DNA or RNA helicase